jgi:transketolase
MEVVKADGHDMDALADGIDKAIAASERPVAILADTVKGKGVDFMENEVPWHYGSVDSELKIKAHASIDKMYEGLLKGAQV